jgi:hypothetical protein
VQTDHADGQRLAPTGGDIAPLLTQRKVDSVSWADWQRLDAFEQQQGKANGKLRQKLVSIDEMMRVVRHLRSH